MATVFHKKEIQIILLSVPAIFLMVIGIWLFVRKTNNKDEYKWTDGKVLCQFQNGNMILRIGDVVNPDLKLTYSPIQWGKTFKTYHTDGYDISILVSNNRIVGITSGNSSIETNIKFNHIHDYNKLLKASGADQIEVYDIKKTWVEQFTNNDRTIFLARGDYVLELSGKNNRVNGMGLYRKNIVSDIDFVQYLHKYVTPKRIRMER